MKYHEYRPHSILEDTVKCFWVHEGTYSADQVQAITPDGCVELIFNFGSPYVLMNTTPPRTLPAAVIVGFQKKTIRICVDGTVRVVAARLFAWGALALLQNEIRALVGVVTAPSAEWNSLVQRLERHVLQGEYEVAETTLQEFLIQKALTRNGDVKQVQAAARLLHHTRGQCRIEEVADLCHTSVRQLERGFQRVIGATPKFFARTLRFEQAQRRLMFVPQTDLTAQRTSVATSTRRTSSRSSGNSPATPRPSTPSRWAPCRTFLKARMSCFYNRRCNGTGTSAWSRLRRRAAGERSRRWRARTATYQETME